MNYCCEFNKQVELSALSIVYGVLAAVNPNFQVHFRQLMPSFAD